MTKHKKPKKARGKNWKPVQRRKPPFRLQPYNNVPSLNFNDPRLYTNQRQQTTWEKLDHVLANGKTVLSFHFLDRFTVTDRHIADILFKYPNIFNKLEDLRAGSLVFRSFQISEGAAIQLAKHCPKLKQVRFLGAIELTDRVVAAFLHHCKDLTYLEISGREQESGKIICPSALHALRSTGDPKCLAPNRLRKLVFCNQANLDIENCKALTVRYPDLEFVYGNTQPDDLDGVKTLRFGTVEDPRHMPVDERTGSFTLAEIDILQFSSDTLQFGKDKSIDEAISKQMNEMVLDD